ncbi:MAG: hypothetical protein KME06_03100 [Kastovskya adunca ATA6-11-RM4]|jgi:hypothetical protein|nr:hypothetical protein [Kastovskya adunca ATA6-11-RM4]
MVISDLNYLETASPDVVGAGGYSSFSLTDLNLKTALVRQDSKAKSSAYAVYGNAYSSAYSSNYSVIYQYD